MFNRKAVTVSAAALAVVALSIPVVNAQDGDAGTSVPEVGSLESGSLESGSLESGSLGGGSLGGRGPGGGASGDGGNEGAGGESGSLDSASADESSLGDLVPTPEAACELPDLGGSVAKFYPLFGISGIPSGVLDIVTSALGSFPNVLDMVAGQGGGAALIDDTGSLAAPLCTSIFGGELVLPPVTVVVDEDGNPVTTVTGTVTRSSPGAVTSTSTGDQAPGVRSADPGSGTVALPTSVPTPGA